MTKTKEKKKVLKPDIVYPKTIHVVPFTYDLYRDQDWDETQKNDLGVYIGLEEAESMTEQDEGEGWIAVYELKELVRVTKTVAVKDRVVMK